MEPLAHTILDVEVEAVVIVLAALMMFLEIYKCLVVPGEVAQPAGLHSVVMVAPLIVAFYMQWVDVYSHLPHCVYHRDGVWRGLVGSVARCVLELAPVCPLIVGFVLVILFRDVYREGSDCYLLPNLRLSYTVRRHPQSLLCPKHLPLVELCAE
jgi:hypothetical protein